MHDRRPWHPYNAGTEHVGFSPIRHKGVGGGYDKHHRVMLPGTAVTLMIGRYARVPETISVSTALYWIQNAASPTETSRRVLQRGTHPDKTKHTTTTPVFRQHLLHCIVLPNNYIQQYIRNGLQCSPGYSSQSSTCIPGIALGQQATVTPPYPQEHCTELLIRRICTTW